MQLCLNTASPDDVLDVALHAGAEGTSRSCTALIYVCMILRSKGSLQCSPAGSTAVKRMLIYVSLHINGVLKVLETLATLQIMHKLQCEPKIPSAILEEHLAYIDILKISLESSGW